MDTTQIAISMSAQISYLYKLTWQFHVTDTHPHIYLIASLHFLKSLIHVNAMYLLNCIFKVYPQDKNSIYV